MIKRAILVTEAYLAGACIVIGVLRLYACALCLSRFRCAVVLSVLAWIFFL